MTLSPILQKIKARYYLNKLRFEILCNKKVYLYAGDVPALKEYNKFVGLSLNQCDRRHLKHDVTQRHRIPDNSVDIYQSEDVFEHIAFELLPSVINDIYRILKPGGIFRLSLPDYRCNILANRCLKNSLGEILFDPIGGGDFVKGKVINMGHVWFPRFESVRSLLSSTRFESVYFYHYYSESGDAITNKIDYSIGFVQRTPDNDERVRNPYRPMSIVVDCIKQREY